MGKSGNRCAGWLLALVLVLGTGLRFWHLTDRSIWFDEAFTWRMIQYPFGEMLHRITLDNSPPLYFVVLKCWSACFGDSLLALRSLSVLMGTVTIFAMYLFVRAAKASTGSHNADHTSEEGRGAEAALLAAALVAISAFQIRWSWDARPYAFGAALALLSSWAAFRALQAEANSCQRTAGAKTTSRSALRWWLVYAGFATLFAYTHYFAMFALAAQAVFILGVLLRSTGSNARQLLREPLTRHAILAYGLVGACWLPWLPFFMRQMSQVRSDFWIHPFRPWDLAHTVYQMFIEPENAAISLTGSLWAFDLCALGWLILLWRPRQDAVFVAASALTPIGASIVLSRLGVHIFLLRYLLFSQLFFLAGLAILVSRIPSPLERRLVAGLVVVWGLFVSWEFCEKADFANRPGAIAAADWIVENADPQDPVVVSSPFCYLPILYHLRDRRSCYLYQEEGGLPHYLGTAVFRPDDTINDSVLRASQSARVWLVDTTNNVGGARTVPTMKFKDARQRQVFPEVFGLGDLIVQEYVALGRPERREESPRTTNPRRVGQDH